MLRLDAHDPGGCMRGVKLRVPQGYDFPADQLPKNIRFFIIEAFVY